MQKSFKKLHFLQVIYVDWGYSVLGYGRTQLGLLRVGGAHSKKAGSYFFDCWLSLLLHDQKKVSELPWACTKRITLLGHKTLNSAVRKSKIMFIIHLQKVKRNRVRVQCIHKCEKWSNSNSLAGLD